jgi:hypothetical protein
LLTGRATPNVKVRLASPAGAAMFAQSDRAGRWRLLLPAAQEVRLFGLSAPGQGRAVQAEGYIAITPSGLTAQLRAGSGALVLGAQKATPTILAVDFDHKGGAVISGDAPASGPAMIDVDGSVRNPARVDAEGRFMLALNEPLRPGDHVVTVTAAGGGRAQMGLTVSTAEPLTAGPFRAQLAPGGWRVDWLTPGGGVQSTLLRDREASPS